ncbi:1,4-dihydroxy-2-naphthoate octaprenyltransferase [Marinobacter segnicrescens]|uniref:1,4-dihydroxy-2-naphthoate octaprenyltransferase n=1 Tax=Marinobacter segnicrescens TaxID=430453 RepID=A0A1I0CX47_9GAMM|nr:prenyltransferase [Marinobacter segnicrescens]SET23705.1 1,4-dihydroxy-2-naphthoate octaprenyltransferase [Marinobacter segnicrescens]
MTLYTVVRSMRLPFLVLTPACVLVGVATALATSGAVAWLDVCLALTGALAAHIGVNTLNEYQDFASGLDALTVRTPFSGGSGALVTDPGAATAVRWVAILSLAVTVLVGSYFMARYGSALLPVGVLGLATIVLYTGWLNRRPWLCLVAPGLAFGPLMVMGTHFVLTGEYSLLAAFASLIPFFLVNNLLLLNQYPDIKADNQVGRRHLPIVYGRRFSTQVYGIQLGFAALLVLAGVAAMGLPALSLLVLLPLGAGALAWMGARRRGEQPAAFQKTMGWNVVAAVSTPVVLAVTLVAGS